MAVENSPVGLVRDADDLRKFMNTSVPFVNRNGDTLSPIISIQAEAESRKDSAITAINGYESEVQTDKNQAIITISGYEQDALDRRNDFQLELNHALQSLGIEYPPIQYAAGLTIDRITQSYERNGVIYVNTSIDSYPITTTGNFDEAGWQIVQAINSATVVFNISDVKALADTPNIDRASYSVSGFYAGTEVGGGQFIYDASRDKEDHNGGTVIAPEAIAAWDGTQANLSVLLDWAGTGTGAFVRIAYEDLFAEYFGAVGDKTNATGNTSAVWAAIKALRSDETLNVIQYIGGPSVTAYKSGFIRFGRGHFALLPDQFDITQDLGITFKGEGSRRTNQAIPGATTLLFVGSSTGYGFKFTGNGARAPHFEDLDICYNDALFTGDLVDTLASPGLTMTRCRIGCFGGFAATRLQTARSCVRTTYDEFEHFEDVVFDGAVDGWWSDDVRSLNGNTFGGFGTLFENCVFYDFKGSHIRHDGNRTRQGIVLINPSFNPINIDCQRAVNLTNIDGLNWSGGICTPSTTKKATIEWFKLDNCTGYMNGASIGDLSKAGTVSGYLDISNNKIFSTGGITITGGAVSGKGNEFRKSAQGWILEPTSAMSVSLGPDLFLSAVTTSYYIPADNINLGGTINYSAELDASTSKFFNTSTRITVKGNDERIQTVSSLPSSTSKIATGRTYSVTANGTLTLHTPELGTSFSVTTVNGATFNIAAPAGVYIRYGATTQATNISSTAGELGALIEFVALSATVWIAIPRSGSWTFS